MFAALEILNLKQNIYSQTYGPRQSYMPEPSETKLKFEGETDGEGPDIIW